ncbi:MAG: hypothetical protein Q9209_007772 [Squamulea sp. 1 TL-2023]
MSSLQAASAPATITHPNPSPPSSPATRTPHSNRPPKRKLDTEESPTCKRQQLEPSPASTSAVSPDPNVARQALQDKRDQASQTEGGILRGDEPPAHGSKRDKLLEAQGYNRDHDRQTQEITQEYDPSIRQDSRDHNSDSRHHESEDQSLNKPHQPSSAPLSKANLRLLQQEVATFEVMDNESTSSSQARKRRAPSRQTSNSDLVSGTSGRSKESTPSHNFYRYNILRRARVQIHSQPPPKTIQPQLDIIFKRAMTDERMQKIRDLAKAQSEIFCDGTGGASREDDLVEAAHTALFTMHKDRTLVHRRKADWNIELKPSFKQLGNLNLSALDQHHSDSDNILDRHSKRQQAEQPFPSPNASHSTMPPPAASATGGQTQPVQDGAVKTPRPDFTCGLRDSVIAKALLDRGLSKAISDDFLEALQLDKRLCSNPTQHFLELRFPILVIEGKAYTTGKTLFEAENQAAVSGSSMLNLQRQLASLHDSVKPTSQQRESPLAFSVCTQGPILELWVHHLETTDNITKYHMNIIATCHGSLADELERFILRMDCLITWYMHDYLKEIADQLFDIASHVAR